LANRTLALMHWLFRHGSGNSMLKVKQYFT
jgi:hypothetical protein